MKFFFASQVATRPPTFLINVNYPEAVAPSYKRYLINRLREEFKLDGTPLKVFFRGRKQKERD